MSKKTEQNKKIFIIATSFAPRNVVGSIRLSKFAKYLIKLGWEVTVLTLPINDEELIDCTLLSDEMDSIKIIRIPYSRFYNKLIIKLRSRISKHNKKKENGFPLTKSTEKEKKLQALKLY